MMVRIVRLATAVACLLFPLAAAAQGAPAVFGEPAWIGKEAERPQLRLAKQSPAQRVQLGPVTEKDIERVRAENRRGRKGGTANVQPQRVAIGLSRSPALEAAIVPKRELDWTPVEGGRAARLEATSPEALALRVALGLAGVPLDVEMVFFGSRTPQRLYGPYRVGDIADRSVPWWSPMTEGETLTIELFVPRDGALGGTEPGIAEVAHLLSSPVEREADKRTIDIGSSGSCNVDVACSPLNTSSAFRTVAASVAKMVFTDSGFTFLCTGTLLNDMDASTQRPWFFGANHCFDNDSAPFKTPSQMQTTASTVTTFWFFEALACGAGVNPTWQQVTGGATYIYSNPQSDALLLLLNNPPPAGAFYAGWDANPLAASMSAIGIHHPQGDLKKVSQGTVLRYAPWDSSSNSDQYVEVRWSSGTTEGGSSGSGLFTVTASQYLFRGGLRGGSALCSNPQGTDLYSRFDQIYPAISQHLGNTPNNNTPFANFTSLWWVRDEAGWALNLIHRAGSNIIFGTWCTYGTDGKSTWIVMPSGSWSSSNTYSGTLYTTSGPAFNAAYDPALHTITPAGTGTLNFSDANNGTWTYSVNGLSGVKNIRRFEF